MLGLKLIHVSKRGPISQNHCYVDHHSNFQRIRAINAGGEYIWQYLDGLVQERRNSSVLAMQVRLSCLYPSILF